MNLFQPTGRPPVLPPIAGVAPPQGALARAALQLAVDGYPPVMLNHALRSYYFATLLGPAGLDEEVVFLAALLHDIGLTAPAGSARTFDLQGADAARMLLWDFGMPSDRAWLVWETIALNSVTLAGDRPPEGAAVHAGLVADVTGRGLDRLPQGALDMVVAAFPRLGFKAAFADLLHHEALRQRTSAAEGATHALGGRCCAGFLFCEAEAILAAAPFAE